MEERWKGAGDVVLRVTDHTFRYGSPFSLTVAGGGVLDVLHRFELIATHFHSRSFVNYSHFLSLFLF